VRVSDDKIAEFAKLVMDAGQKISQLLGYEGHAGKASGGTR
jgi:hypothetical protein